MVVKNQARTMFCAELLKDRSSRRDVGRYLNASMTRDRGLRRELRLGSKETFYKALGQIIGLEVAKRVVGPWAGLREVSD
jgi:hypothetical protein